MKPLSLASIEQMQDYLEVVERDGWYWGNKAHFLRRHEEIRGFLKAMRDEKLAESGKNEEIK